MLSLKRYVLLLQTVRPGPFISDLILTTLTSIATTITSVLIIRMLAGGLGPEQFGAYALSRRILATVMPVSTLTMSMAIPRYVAISHTETERDSYFLSGLILALVPGIAVLLIGFVFDEQLTLILFHDELYLSLFRMTLWMITGYSVYITLYAFHRGMQEMRLANFWQMCIIAFGPLLLTWFFADIGRADVIVALFAGLMWCAVIPLGVITFKVILRTTRRIDLSQPLRQMALYGLPRVPGGFALAGLFAIGPLLAPYFGSLKETGYLAAGQSVLTVLQGGLVGFGLVALPRLAQMVAAERQEAIKKAVEDILGLVLHLGLFAVVQGLLWADTVVLALLGPQYQEAIPLIRVILLSLVPYLAYVMLRSVIDAVEERAINTMNLFVALIIALVVGVPVASSGLGVLGLALGTTIGFIILGISTVYYLSQKYEISWQVLRVQETLFLNVSLLLFAGLLKWGWMTLFPEGSLLVWGGIVLVCVFGIYMFALWQLRFGWLLDLVKRVLVRGIK